MWQEQQLERQGTATAAGQHRSRREARDAERRATETGDHSGLHPSGVVDSSGNIWDTLSRRAASQLMDAAAESERRTGRRVSEASAPAEPASHLTPGRPQVPTYDPRRPVADAYGQSTRAGYAPAPVLPEAEDTRTRPTSRVDSILGYAGASGAPRLLADEAPALDLSASLDHTMTRRELRALRETAELGSDRSTGSWSPSWDARVVPAQTPPARQAPAAETLAGTAFSSYTDSATVEMSAVDRAAFEAEVPVAFATEAAAEEPGVDTVLMDKVEVEIPLPKAFRASLAEPQPRASVSPAVEPMPSAPAAGTFAAAGSPAIDGLQGFEALIAQASTGLDVGPAASTLQTPVAPLPRQERPYTPPAGHWSVQAQYKDDELPFAGLLSRNVGSTTGSTNALIMPNDPQPDLLSAVNSTGEIFVTGSYDLPRILSSTGAPSEQYDSSEIDRLFEASQEEHHTADVVPVRAARAVAGHSSTRSVVSPRKRHSAALPTVLAITAALMAVGVVGLLFAGYVLRIF